ncbi:MAG TPA: TonB family protein [Acidobacteriaceae bacterium]|jgi:TonB family protein|nr:TonB family protein [Acidobacteriaceae bacterium]
MTADTEATQMKRVNGGVLVMALMVLGFQAGMAEGSSAGQAQKSKALPMQPPAADKPAGDPETLVVEVVNHVPPVDRDNLKGYWPAVEDRTKAQWMHGLPAVAKPPQSVGGEVRVTCWVHTDGRVTNMAVEQTSGKSALDRAALAAISGSAPYDSFPYGIAVDQVKVRFTFVYNGGATSVVPLVH